MRRILAAPRSAHSPSTPARQPGEPSPDVQRRVRRQLGHLVARHGAVSNRVFHLLLLPLHHRTWQIRTPHEQLARLYRPAEPRTLVFLPSHRSYVDPLVLAAALRPMRERENVRFAGANLALPVLKHLARRAGVVFVPRSGSDPVFRTALRSYLRWLVSAGQPLEWYLEGSRSRNGLLGPPRYGLLRQLVEAAGDSDGPSAHLVPVSLTYDLLPELPRLAQEERGAVKRGENLRWLARYARAQHQPSGTVDVHFAEALSVPAAIARAYGDRRAATGDLARQVGRRIQHVTPVTATALIGLVMLGPDHQRPRTPQEIHSALAEPLDLMRRRRVPGSGLEHLRTLDGVRAKLDHLTRGGVLTRAGGGAAYHLESSQCLLAAYYRNTAVHWFLEPAIGGLARWRAAGPSPHAEAKAEASRLRELLEHVTPFPYDDASALTADPELLAGPQLTARIVRSFAETCLIVFHHLAHADPEPATGTGPQQAACLARGRRYLADGLVRCPEALSPALFAAVLRAAGNAPDTAGRPPDRERWRVLSETSARLLADLASCTAAGSTRSPGDCYGRD